jgi:hypothetical protein
MLPNHGVITIDFQIFVVFLDVENYFEFFRSIMQQLSSIGLLS